MEITARLRNLKMSPRKVRLVIDMIRGLGVDEAETRLLFIKKDAARPVLKLLKSAIANAEHNFKLERNTLWISSISADAGMTLKRWMPRAMGRATPIRKRMSHIHIVLTEVPRVKKTKKARLEIAKKNIVNKQIGSKKKVELKKNAGQTVEDNSTNNNN